MQLQHPNRVTKCRKYYLPFNHELRFQKCHFKKFSAIFLFSFYYIFLRLLLVWDRIDQVFAILHCIFVRFSLSMGLAAGL